MSSLEGVTVSKKSVPGGLFKVRISIGDFMYFDSPICRPDIAETIFENLKKRLVRFEPTYQG